MKSEIDAYTKAFAVGYFRFLLIGGEVSTSIQADVLVFSR